MRGSAHGMTMGGSKGLHTTHSGKRGKHTRFMRKGRG